MWAGVVDTRFLQAWWQAPLLIEFLLALVVLQVILSVYTEPSDSLKLNSPSSATVLFYVVTTLFYIGNPY